MELENTPDGRRSEAPLRVCGPGSGWLWTVFLIANCHQWGEKWRLGALFLAIFGLGLMIVLMILIAAYLVWIRSPKLKLPLLKYKKYNLTVKSK